MLLKNHLCKLKTWTWKIPLWSLSESQWKLIFPKLTMAPLNWIRKNIYNRNKFVNRISAQTHTQTQSHNFPISVISFTIESPKTNTKFPYRKFFRNCDRSIFAFFHRISIKITISVIFSDCMRFKCNISINHWICVPLFILLIGFNWSSAMTCQCLVVVVRILYVSIQWSFADFQNGFPRKWNLSRLSNYQFHLAYEWE